MQNFRFSNPTEIVFGRGSIAELATLIPRNKKILMLYGSGSIKRNGVYDQVMEALRGTDFLEFGGIEPNPRHETCMKAVELARKEKVDFLLSVGGGSVLDGTKYIAAAVPFAGDPWDILARKATVNEALPLGCVLTLPATGSESNGFSVVSRDATNEKLAFYSPLVYPKFAVLDPAVTVTLDARQTANGIVDAYAHVLEQYLTYDVNAPLQDRQAEAILLTLIEEGPKVLAKPDDYDVRANIMWCATNALNGLIACGVPQDWTTHMIGHELTALYGLDHAQTLAVVFPATLRRLRANKREKLLRYARRVWNLTGDSPDSLIDQAIDRTENFFRSLGVKTRLEAYGIRDGLERIPERLKNNGSLPLGERGDVDESVVRDILNLCAV
ncbi:MAG TPA: iron-containing alcohol dehydrogenase [Candidatus Hydrogenedentes bacterium]|nr:iron-containing alcohol dehydrogenase [Candidatus Hydrogenedentota bacterium]